MAVDSRNKRAALLGLGSPVPRLLPTADGGITTIQERRMLVFLYPFGESATTPATNEPGYPGRVGEHLDSVATGRQLTTSGPTGRQLVVGRRDAGASGRRLP